MVAISYDSTEILKAFAGKREITFPLLSDEESRVIDAYMIRNKEAGSRIEGVPHPGTILIDQKGIIRAKLGHEGYRKRHEPEELIKAAKALE